MERATLEIFRYVVLLFGILWGMRFLTAAFDDERFLKSRRRRIFRHCLFLIPPRIAAWSFALLLLFLIGEPSVRTVAQYSIWHNDPAAKYLVPPHQPWSYFIDYVSMRFWLWRLIGIGVASLLFVLAMQFIVKPSKEMRMSRSEAGLIAFGVAIAGWPYLLVYLVALILFYFLMLLFLTLCARYLPFLRAASPPSDPGGGGEPRPQAGVRREEGGGEFSPKEPPRFPVALPATLSLLVIPFANTIIEAVGLTVLRVTNLSL